MDIIIAYAVTILNQLIALALSWVTTLPASG